ncbi:Muc22p [Rhodotorula mucilaginosa]|uniref:Muc22p n=1 Tax=Rhodotorula mucilaginosa TaxID=5537 RepID=A0A9P6W454_RHOMI|nr:Muc22p [Rhodotorula mucilaginosa]TKA58136.1 hypothetical protein B0A53_00538 [Rhodotorula sp. CCFEE 5036]
MRRSTASAASSPSAWLVATVLGLAATQLAVAQSAAEIGTEQDTLSTLIPGTCSAQCSAWLTSLGACPVSSSPTYSTCVCDQTFVNNFAACAPCLATEFTAANDATNAATANQAPADLTNYCATAGTVVTTDSTTSSLTSTTSLTSLTSTTSTSTTSLSSAVVTSTGGLNGGVGSLFTATTPSLTFSTVSSATSSIPSGDLTAGSSTRGPNGPTTIFQSGQNVPFPTQTKSTNAFANGAPAGSRVVRGQAVAIAALAVAGGWMLA